MIYGCFAIKKSKSISKNRHNIKKYAVNEAIENNMSERILLSSPHMSDEGYELEYINDAFKKNWIAPLGENVTEFEKAIAKFTGAENAVALSAGTAALHMAMILAGVQPGDEVFCQSLTFSASANPVKYLGANPVFIDSEYETWNMDPDALRKAFETHKRPKAVRTRLKPLALYIKEKNAELSENSAHFPLTETKS